MLPNTTMTGPSSTSLNPSFRSRLIVDSFSVWVVKYPDNVYLFFGKETKGLPENLLHDNPQTSVRIPMLNNPDARSLNLSNSVAIGVYEVLRQWNYPKLLCEGKLRDYEWDV